MNAGTKPRQQESAWESGEVEDANAGPDKVEGLHLGDRIPV